MTLSFILGLLVGTVFIGGLLFIKLINYKEEISIKMKSIERLEHLNAELQQALVQQSEEDEQIYSNQNMTVAL